MIDDYEVVQLSCNPTHVYHKQCLQMWTYCPVCLVEIDRNAAALDR